MKQKQNQHLRFWMHFHASLTLVVCGSYFGLAFFAGPSFFFSDLRNTFSAWADDTLVVTATVPGPPAQPVITAAAVCSGGTLSVDADWADDINTVNFDVYRGGSPLVTGLTASAYQDANVALSTTYSYYVVANGYLGGTATSSTVSVTTPSVCVVEAPAASVTITTLGGEDVRDRDSRPKIASHRPRISGTGTIVSALITVQISRNGSTILTAETTANTNGYWTLLPSKRLSTGVYTLNVTATDQTDSTRQATDEMDFEIEDTDEETQVGTKAIVQQLPGPNIPPVADTEPLPAMPVSGLPFTLKLEVVNYLAQVYQGRDLIVRVTPENIAEVWEGQPISVWYTVFDGKAEEILITERNILLDPHSEWEERLEIPLSWAGGQYTVRVEVNEPRFTVSSERPFYVIELPLLHLGGTMVVTYPQLIRALGWLSLVLLVWWLFYVFLWLRERMLIERAVRHVAAQQLRRAGVIRMRRKGVIP